MSEEKKGGAGLRPFFVLWSGQAASLFGSEIVQFALIWWLTQETGSAAVLAVASLIGILPQVVVGPFAGVLVDRWSRKATMLVSDSLVAAATLGLSLAFALGEPGVPAVLLVLGVRSLAGAFHLPALQSSIPLMVPVEHLTRIQGLNQTLHGLLNLVAAPLGALLLGILPLAGVLAIDLVTAALALTALGLTRVPRPPRAKAESLAPVDDPEAAGAAGAEAKPQGALASFMDDMVQGLRYVWQWKALMALMAVVMMINLVISPAFTLLPLLVQRDFSGGAWELGLVQSALGLGFLVGGLLLGAGVGSRHRMGTALSQLGVLGLLTGGIAFIPNSSFLLVPGAIFLVGVAISLVNGPIGAIFQARVDPALQGRFNTLSRSLSLAMIPLGLALAGPLAEVAGVRAWFVLAGAVTLIMGFMAVSMKAVRRMGHEAVPTGTEATTSVEDQVDTLTAEAAPDA